MKSRIITRLVVVIIGYGYFHIVVIVISTVYSCANARISKSGH